MAGRLTLAIRSLRYPLRFHEYIVGIFKNYLDYQRQPRNNFTLQGYEVIPDFWEQDECDRLVKLINIYLRDRSYIIYGDCYLVCRKDLQKVDLNVQVITNAQKIDAKLAQLFHSHLIEEMFEQRTNEKVRLKSIRLQVDAVDVQTKRSYHNDNVLRRTYKAFIYLNDVNEYGDGPYTIIPGSHRHIFRKLINSIYNRIIIRLHKETTFRPEDMKLFYSDKQSVSIFGKAGTLIISNQQLAHKGWHQQDKNRRYVLVCDLIAKQHDDDQPYLRGREQIELLQKA